MLFLLYRYSEIINRDFFLNTGRIVCCVSVALLQQTSAYAVTIVSTGKSLMFSPSFQFDEDDDGDSVANPAYSYTKEQTVFTDTHL